MARRIEEDRKYFRTIYEGDVRREMKKFINDGTLYKMRPDGKGYIPVKVKRISNPLIIYGGNKPNPFGEGGIGRGQGKKGDVIQKGKGQGGKEAGDEHQDGIEVSVSQDYVLQLLKDSLKLPALKPKPSDVLDEDYIKYTNISKTGPQSLRHNRRTFLQALKRNAALGKLEQKVKVPGFDEPVSMIDINNNDKRYRQFRVIKKPSSNAAIFFCRDGSGSMDETKCELVSNISWWLDLWIRHHYKKVERCYVWHDTTAQEVDETKFYNYRYGGGTICSSALKFVANQFETRFPPNKWNIYVFYFTDGDNSHNDNPVFVQQLKEQFPESVINFVGIVQILSYSEGLKGYVDDHKQDLPNVKTTEIKPNGIGTDGDEGESQADFYGSQIKQVLIDLLGNKESANV